MFLYQGKSETQNVRTIIHSQYSKTDSSSA